MHLGEAVDPGGVGLADRAQRPAVLDHHDHAVGPLGQQGQRLARPWLCGVTVTAVSKMGWEALTFATVAATTSVGMSCGRIAIPPRRATVSAIRRPETAVMLATTSGSVVPIPSVLRQVDVQPGGRPPSGSAP